MHYDIINATSQFDMVILANGDFPQDYIPLNILHNTKHLVCCDGAGKYLLEHTDIKPDAIVGDGDSLPESFKEQYHDICHHVAEQDDNDLTKALRYARTKYKPTTVAFLGITGKREDHTLGNIALLMRYFQEFGIQPIAITDNGYFIPVKGSNSFSTFAHQQISIFNFGCTRIESEGLKWQSFAYKQLWQGSLNEAIGSKIVFDADGYYLIYATHLPKV